MVDVANVLVGVVATAGAALAWLAKLRWSREFAAAKDEVIRAKDTQIETLRLQVQEIVRAKDAQIEALRTQVQELKEWTPTKLREYYLSSKAGFQEYIDVLVMDLSAAQGRIAALERQLQLGAENGAPEPEGVQDAAIERDRLATVFLSLRTLAASLESRQWSMDPASFGRITRLHRRLREMLSTRTGDDGEWSRLVGELEHRLRDFPEPLLPTPHEPTSSMPFPLVQSSPSPFFSPSNIPNGPQAPKPAFGPGVSMFGLLSGGPSTLEQSWSSPFFSAGTGFVGSGLGIPPGFPSLSSMAPGTSAFAPGQPPVDIIDEGTQYRICVDVPGAIKEDLEVTQGAAQGTLWVRVRRQASPYQGVPLRLEGGAKHYSRLISVAEDADMEKVSTILQDGVLTLVVPKRRY